MIALWIGFRVTMFWSYCCWCLNSDCLISECRSNSNAQQRTIATIAALMERSLPNGATSSFFLFTTNSICPLLCPAFCAQKMRCSACQNVVKMQETLHRVFSLGLTSFTSFQAWSHWYDISPTHTPVMTLHRSALTRSIGWLTLDTVLPRMWEASAVCVLFHHTHITWDLKGSSILSTSSLIWEFYSTSLHP